MIAVKRSKKVNVYVCKDMRTVMGRNKSEGNSCFCSRNTVASWLTAKWHYIQTETFERLGVIGDDMKKIQMRGENLWRDEQWLHNTPGVVAHVHFVKLNFSCSFNWSSSSADVR